MPRVRLADVESSAAAVPHPGPGALTFCPDKRCTETFEFRLTPLEASMLEQLSREREMSKARITRLAIRELHAHWLNRKAPAARKEPES